MHTLLVVAGGFLLLGLCLLVAKLMGGAPAAFARAALVFLPLWFVGAGVNLWIGVATAGYTVREELPIFALVFTVPAAVAMLVWFAYRDRH